MRVCVLCEGDLVSHSVHVHVYIYWVLGGFTFALYMYVAVFLN